MQCYLVLFVNTGRPELPKPFTKETTVEIGDNAYIVGNNTMTTGDIAKAFGMCTEAEDSRWGLVVKLDVFSGCDAQEVVERVGILQRSP